MSDEFARRLFWLSMVALTALFLWVAVVTKGWV